MIKYGKKICKSKGVVTLAMACVALTAVFGCSVVKEVPVERVRVEWRDREIETVRVDSVQTERVVYIKGDTVLDVRRETKTRTVEIRDTTTIEKTDTITEIREVERELSTWEKTKQELGGLAMGALALMVIMIVIKMFKR